MALALAPPPVLSLRPTNYTKSRRCCRCSSTISRTDDSPSSPPTTTSSTCRPAVILPGLGNNTNDYHKLTLILKEYGVPTVVAKVSRIDWLRNAAGLVDPNYWRGTLRPRPVLDWYLNRVDEAVNEAKELAQGNVRLPIYCCLGMVINRNRKENILTISQETYLNKVIKKFGMKEAKSDNIPFAAHMNLCFPQCPKTEAEFKDMKNIPYDNAIGSVMFSMVTTRPDLATRIDILNPLYRLNISCYSDSEALPIIGANISLVGHSAGGWLARVYLQEFEPSDISLLLTLGTPHLPPPKGVSGVIDQTRGLLNYVEQHCAKAVYTPELRYVCIAGRYLLGARLIGASNNGGSAVMVDIDQPAAEIAVVNGTTTSTPAAATLRARFVGQGYKQVCGQADVWGDGVVPEISAHLEGALNISLDGVYHSPVGSDDITRPWYGSPAIIEQWIHHLVN